MRKLVIVKPGCREFANHLWNYLSIYAYGIETGARVYNPSFFAWHRYFNLVGKESLVTRIISAFPSFKRVWRTFDTLYGSYLIRARAACTLLTLQEFMYLPPTRPLARKESSCDITYLIGGFFRNPLGLERYRSQVVSAFTPKESVLKKIEAALVPFSGKQLIGIHLRQKPFKGFENEHFIIPLPRVRRIVEEYLREKKLGAKEVALIVIADEILPPSPFGNIDTHVSTEDEVADIFLLAKCRVVIGTNSTFSNLAAWFGNIPHIVQSNEPMDWEYYRNATVYFENKYADFAF